MFAHPEYLYFCAFIPVFLLLFIGRLKSNKNRLTPYVHSSCLKVVTGFVSIRRRVIKFSFLLGVFLFLILALAQHQSQKEQKEVKVRGSEVMILVDVSKSMLVEDMGGLSRLNVMKKNLDKLITLLTGGRVGLISFSGSSILVSPLTLDMGALKLFLKSLSPGDHILQGTDFGGALRAALQAFKRGSALDPSKGSRIIVVASDGEDNQGESQNQVQLLADQNIRVFTLGFGTKKGGVIPISDQRGNKFFKKNQQGNLVISHFNEKSLTEIANLTKGAYYPMSIQGNTIKKVYADIQEVGEGVVSSYTQNAYIKWYQYYLMLALLFGFFYFLMGEKKLDPVLEWHSYLEKKE